MGRIRAVIEGLLIFFTGIFFAFYTYPFFESLFGNVSTLATVDGWENFETIVGLAWAGWFVIIILWIIVAPIIRVATADQE